MDSLRLTLALLLPWLAGIAWMRIVWMQPSANGTARANWPLIVGYGYLLGMLGVTLILRAMDVVGLLTAFWPSLLIVTAILAAALAVGRRRLLPQWSIREAFRSLPPWQRWVFTLLLGLLALRLASLGIEVSLRPVYPVDAITAWTNRARIWFETATLATPLTDDVGWWSESLEGAYRTSGRPYPMTVPLIQLWSAAALGYWDDSLINIPWLLCWIALGMAFYGHARLAGIPALVTMSFTYLFLSLPLFNAHTALAGYADLWLAAVFGMTSLSFFLWIRTRDRSHAAIALVLACAMIAIKKPGFMWLAPLFVAWLAAIMPMRWFLGVFGGILAGLAVIMMAGGIEWTIPGLGTIAIAPNEIRLPRFGAFRVLLAPPLWDTQMVHLFVLDNWHLAWMLIVAAIVVSLPMTRYSRDLQPMVVLVLSCIALYGFIFFFTRQWTMLEIGTLNNRVMLQMMPTLMFFTLLVGYRACIWWGSPRRTTATHP
ncbi:MAG: hypothetical protein PHQ14_13720 [Chromatiales bacterium]|nr:hypothetical protein [Chromatiales bacterium]